MNSRKHFVRLLIACLWLSLTGCQTLSAERFKLDQLVKTDIDMVADLHRQVMTQLIKEMTVKLYKRNPRELRKASPKTLEERLAQITAPPPAQGYAELNGLRGNAAIQLAFDPNYTSDRVFALMFGLETMIAKAYNKKHAFYFTDKLNQQSLYNSARNIETVAWLLKGATRPSQPMILSNGVSDEGYVNASFERLIGKMIATQDMMASIVADDQNRVIKNVVHKAASLTLLPI
ncbi:MAG: hypothetical protein ACPGMR_08530 [Pontibacterium sp.]